jgi:hypothetical protein
MAQDMDRAAAEQADGRNLNQVRHEPAQAFVQTVEF